MDPFGPLLVPLVALLLSGAAAGFAGGLFGIGGGFVVVPALMLILPLLDTAPQQQTHVAIGTSLATIVFTSIRATQAQARRKSVEFSILRSWAPWIVLGTLGGALIADMVSSTTLALIFGLGVLAMSAYFLRGTEPVVNPDAQMPTGAVRAGIAGGLGVVSSLLGIGGGTLATIVMTMKGTPIHRAIGTASGMGAIIAVPGTLGFMLTGLDETGLPWGSIGYVALPEAGAIIVSSVLLAPYGVAAAHKLSPKLLRLVFGSYLVVVGFTMIAKAW